MCMYVHCTDTLYIRLVQQVMREAVLEHGEDNKIK